MLAVVIRSNELGDENDEQCFEISNGNIGVCRMAEHRKCEVLLLCGLRQRNFIRLDFSPSYLKPSQVRMQRFAHPTANFHLARITPIKWQSNRHDNICPESRSKVGRHAQVQ